MSRGEVGVMGSDGVYGGGAKSGSVVILLKSRRGLCSLIKPDA